jgi:hypothetical protein
MSSETNIQLFPGVFRSTVGGENPGFFLHSDGRVGIGNKAPTTRPLWSSDDTDRNKLNVTGHTHIDGNLNVTGYLYGDGSNLSGVTAVVGGYWDLDASNNNIKYEAGNVGIGGAASGTEALTVYGDLNLKSGGQLKLNGQTPVFSNWSVDGSDIYRSTGNVGIGGAASGTNKLKVHGTVEASSFIGIQDVNVPNLDASIITSGIFDTARTGTTSATILTLASTGIYQDTGIRIPNGGCGLLIVQKKRTSNTGPPYYSGNPVYTRDAAGISLYVLSGGTSTGTATDGSFGSFLTRIYNENQITPTMHIEQIDSSQSKITCISSSPNRGCTVVVSYCPLIIP